ncbi:MAG: biotin--[acetyl-CoA-carboxylase] ligase [Flavobacteriaceae bacterium]|nr:biotin--[acetyl-CoA-carboxylase] ligase [Flavobacteriaceae bacterium]
MKVIKLNAIDSTNSYLKELVANTLVGDELVVTALKQEKGRGQQGATWQSQTGKSLTCSLFKRFEGILAADHFLLNMMVSLGVLDALQQLKIPEVRIKWPNDIMSHGNKVAGILIENQIKGHYIDSSVIGIGLNVNETSFVELPQATSLTMVTGRKFDVDQVLQLIAKSIFKKLQAAQFSKFEFIRNSYCENLFRKDIISVFETKEGDRKNGIIKGISRNGKLIISHEDTLGVAYDLKEIKLLV